MEDRKARLKALAAKAGRAKPTEDDAENDNNVDNDGDATQEADTSSNNRKRPVKFRNYTPADQALQEEQETTNNNDAGKQQEQPSSKRTKTTSSDKENEKDKPKSKLEEALEKAIHEVDQEKNNKGSSHTKEDNSLTAMAPKKINWDLKRNIQPKLDKLEKRTQKAIVQLLRERLAKEADDAAAAEEAEEQDELD